MWVDECAGGCCRREDPQTIRVTAMAHQSSQWVSAILRKSHAADPRLAHSTTGNPADCPQGVSASVASGPQERARGSKDCSSTATRSVDGAPEWLASRLRALRLTQPQAPRQTTLQTYDCGAELSMMTA
jgi:hypothetical protein